MMLSDQEFLSAFENCTLPKTEFRHLGHLRICWLYLSAYSFEEATDKICQGILRFATSLGAQHIYQETLTRDWIRLVWNAMQDKKYAEFSDFMAEHAFLLDKDLPSKTA